MKIEIIPNFDKKIKVTKRMQQILDKVRKCDIILNFLDRKVHNPNSQRKYAGCIRDYFVLLDIINIDNYLFPKNKMFYPV